ncbi:MAG TPA: undecaprenyl-diphosphate phosphatase [Gemmatimonadales bacterium]|nr:undecaprenyl-diphosphate phosphatase [Gemmatimonadales bacterium]
MTLWQGLLLGLVQGLTEFLPVSSSGHLRVLEVITGVHTPGVFVEVALHVATLGSVLVVYGGRLWSIIRGVLARRPEDLRVAGLLLLATIPAGVIGVVFHRLVEAAASLVLVGLGFLVTGFMNWSTRRFGGGTARSPPSARRWESASPRRSRRCFAACPAPARRCARRCGPDSGPPPRRNSASSSPFR